MAFYAVYIREAHTSDVWQDPDNLDDKVIFAKPKTYDERVEMGQLCVVKLGIKFPAVIDTFDNGTEFAEHFTLGAEPLRLATFFCDPHSPWQKGGVENAIGRFRRFLPRRTDLDQINPSQIQAAANAFDHSPRLCLDFRTPAEAFSELVLHFERESTSRLPPG